MILCSVRQFERYQGLHSLFGALGKVLETQNLRELSEGRHDIVGDRLYAVAAPQAITRPGGMLEAHRLYLDVHVTLDGTDRIGWAPLDALSAEEAPYDTDRDIVLYRDPPTSVHPVTPGSLVVLFPDDAHLPLLGEGESIHKCVFKVRLDRPPA